MVSFETAADKLRGSTSRKFLARRDRGARHYVGIDLFAARHDEVVAYEDGRIDDYYKYYPTSAGDMAYALLIERADFVINYGEVASTD